MSELIVVVIGAAAAFLLWYGLKPHFAQPDFLMATPSTGATAAQAPLDVYQWPHLGRFDFEVIGTQQHQAALRQAWEQLGEHCVVTLNAGAGSVHNIGVPVEVLVEEVRVGFLSDGDATRFHRRLAYEGRSGQLSQCDARIAVSDLARRGDRPVYDIMLDLKPFRH